MFQSQNYNLHISNTFIRSIDSCFIVLQRRTVKDV